MMMQSVANKRKFHCKSRDGLRCDKYYDPEYHVEIRNKFDENTRTCFGDTVQDNGGEEENVPVF